MLVSSSLHSCLGRPCSTWLSSAELSFAAQPAAFTLSVNFLGIAFGRLVIVSSCLVCRRIRHDHHISSDCSLEQSETRVGESERVFGCCFLKPASSAVLRRGLNMPLKKTFYISFSLICELWAFQPFKKAQLECRL
jgi:hypothetical protein